MSAFLCSDYHISVLAYEAADTQEEMGSPRQIRAVNAAAELLVENLRSVKHRYPGDYPLSEGEYLELFAFAPGSSDHKHDALTVIQAAHCLAYQSCEHPGWETSKAKALLEAIVWRKSHDLKGYFSSEGWPLEKHPSPDGWAYAG